MRLYKIHETTTNMAGRPRVASKCSLSLSPFLSLPFSLLLCVISLNLARETFPTFYEKNIYNFLIKLTVFTTFIVTQALAQCFCDGWRGMEGRGETEGGLWSHLQERCQRDANECCLLKWIRAEGVAQMSLGEAFRAKRKASKTAERGCKGGKKFARKLTKLCLKSGAHQHRHHHRHAIFVFAAGN